MFLRTWCYMYLSNVLYEKVLWKSGVVVVVVVLCVCVFIFLGGGVQKTVKKAQAAVCFCGIYLNMLNLKKKWIKLKICKYHTCTLGVY